MNRNSASGQISSVPFCILPFCVLHSAFVVFPSDGLTLSL